MQEGGNPTHASTVATPFIEFRGIGKFVGLITMQHNRSSGQARRSSKYEVVTFFSKHTVDDHQAVDASTPWQLWGAEVVASDLRCFSVAGRHVICIAIKTL